VAAVRLSSHFTLAEMIASQTATRLSINNQPDAEGVDALSSLCQRVLEPVRVYYGVPFSPSSGYRSKELNDILGGSKDSQHCKCEAADFSIPGIANIDVAEWMRDNVEFDQLILEYYDHGNPCSGWVHVSFVSSPGIDQRSEALTFDGIIYHPGLPKDEQSL